MKGKILLFNRTAVKLIKIKIFRELVNTKNITHNLNEDLYNLIQVLQISA